MSSRNPIAEEFKKTKNKNKTTRAKTSATRGRNI